MDSPPLILLCLLMGVLLHLYQQRQPQPRRPRVYQLRRRRLTSRPLSARTHGRVSKRSESRSVSRRFARGRSVRTAPTSAYSRSTSFIEGASVVTSRPSSTLPPMLPLLTRYGLSKGGVRGAVAPSGQGERA